MPADFTWKTGDTGPVVTDTLTYDNGSVPPFYGATVELVMRSMRSAQALTLTGTAEFVNQQTGAVRYTPTAQDTSNLEGDYMASWVVTFITGQQLTFPTTGYLWGEIQASVGGEQQSLVSLPEVKEYLGIDHNDRAQDGKMMRFIRAIRPQIEQVTGPILPTMFEEWHDGGSEIVELRHPPSTGYGTTPLLNVLGVSEYRGATEFALEQIATPGLGSTYSYMVNVELGSITRRGSGGSTTEFMQGRESVHVVYQSGQSAVPENVIEGTLELIRVNYQTTQARGRARQTQTDEEEVGVALGFFMPRRVREILSPGRRYPSIA